MAEPNGDDPDAVEPDDEPKALEGLKAVLDDADDRIVHDEAGGRPRLTWNSVTDTGGTAATADRAEDERPRSGFQFDLGGALARFAGDESAPPPPPAALRPEPETAEPPATMRAESQATAPAPAPPRVEPVEPADDLPATSLPTRGAPAPSDVPRIEPRTDPRDEWRTDPHDEPRTESRDEVAPEYPRRTPGASLDAQMRAATETVVDPTPTPALRSTERPSVFDDDRPAARTGVPGAPTLPGAPAPIDPSALPVLPSSNPAAPPPIVESIGNAPSTPDINALRSAQLRASKQQRQGKLVGRTLLAFVLIGGLIAASLVFGRSLLFTTEWDAELTPVVNEVEAARGAEFAEVVPLEVLTPSEYGERLRSATIGAAWVDQVPQWRALGLTTGTVTAESVGAALAASSTAIYDPAADTIYRLEGAPGEQLSGDLRVALEAAYDAQSGATAAGFEPATQPVFTGVSTLDSIAARAVDELLAAGGAVPERRAADETLPIPIAYELAAVDVLGEAVLTAAGVGPSTLSLGGDHSAIVAGVLDDGPASTAGALLLPGDVSIAPPTALGTDDWSLVWGTRLPETTVERLVEQVSADSYRAVDRGGLRCFAAVFESPDASAGSAVFAAMLSWAAAAPVASQAVATPLSETRTQLEACDPGADGAVAPNPGVADALITRQIARLTN